MAQRIKADRTALAAYVTPSTAAAGATSCAASSPSAARDLCEWGELLRGAAEVDSASRQIGAMADARGCIAVDAPASGASGASTANVVVVWRGATPSATPASAPCVPPGFSTADGYMRTVSSVVRFGDLDGN
jgi:type IV pilus assembly protein PilV